MMQEYFYALYVFIVQSNGGVATTHPYLLTLKTYPTPGEGPIHPVFASKWPQKMLGQLLKIISRSEKKLLRQFFFSHSKLGSKYALFVTFAIACTGTFGSKCLFFKWPYLKIEHCYTLFSSRNFNVNVMKNKIMLTREKVIE